MKIKGTFEKLLPPELLNFNELTRLYSLLTKILELCQGHERPEILDVGCGDSRMGMALQCFGHNVIGIDSSVEMINTGKKLCKRNDVNCRSWLQDAKKIQFPDNFFDIVICSEMLEHIKGDRDLKKIIKEMKRVCKCGGYIVITTPYMNRVSGTAKYPHYRSFDTLSFRKRFKNIKYFKIPTSIELWMGMVVKNENSKHNRN